MKQLFQYLSESYNQDKQEFIEPCNNTSNSEKENLNEIQDSTEKGQEDITKDNQGN